MLRRNTRLRLRLRREYLYRKSLEGKERQHYEKKRRVREALEECKPIPTELRNEELALRREIDLDGQGRAVPKNIIDDEYAGAALREPKILLTISRNPSVPLTQFVKELKVVFPNSQRMNRGGQVYYGSNIHPHNVLAIKKSYQKLLSPAAHMRSLILFWCMNIVVSPMV